MAKKYHGRLENDPRRFPENFNYRTESQQQELTSEMVLEEETYYMDPSSYTDDTEFVFVPSTSKHAVGTGYLNEEIGEQFKQEMEDGIELEPEDLLEEESEDSDVIEIKEEEEYSNEPSFKDEEVGPSNQFIFVPSSSYNPVLENVLKEEIGQPFKQEMEEEFELEPEEEIYEEASDEPGVEQIFSMEQITNKRNYVKKDVVSDVEIGPFKPEEINPKTGKPFKCGICGKPFYARSLIKRHYQLHSTQMPYECSICLTKFKALANLKRHLNLHLEDKVVNYDHVRPNLAWRSEVEQHRIIVERPRRKKRRPLCEKPEEKFQCRMCETESPYFGHLLKHYNDVHRLDGMTTWKMMYGNTKQEE